MFCRFCGKDLPEDSLFCQYCGKTLSETGEYAENTPAFDEAYYHALAKKTAGSKLRRASKVFFYIALAIFLILNIKMAPGYGETRYFTYVAGAAVAIALTVLYQKKIFPSESAALHRTAILFALTVVLFSVGLRIIYEAKFDAAMSDIPQSGTVHAKITFDDNYFSETGYGVISPKTYLYVNGKKIGTNSVAEIELGKVSKFEGSSSYYHNVQHSGSGTEYVVLNASDLKSSYSLAISFSTGVFESCTLDVEVRYVMNFWDVVFH